MNIADRKKLTSLIRSEAQDLGFDLCGIAASEVLPEHESIISKWCSQGMNGEMSYLCRDIEKRIDPGRLFQGARSVIVTGLNYYSERKQGGNGVPVISRYAYGINYHDVIIGKLNSILTLIHSEYPEVQGKSFVDSAPLLEKAWARKAGLGWPGKHSVLINPQIGSFFFLGVIILDTELEYDRSFDEDSCGSCRLCIDSCPTGAINENRTIDTRRCISYLTLESKAPASDELTPKFEGRVFGCDRCQEVCPWNKNAAPHKTPEFELAEELRKMTAEEFRGLTKEQFVKVFKRSAIARRKYNNFMRNVKYVLPTSH